MKYENIYWTLSLIVWGIFIGGFVAIDYYNTITISNELQRWAATTGAQMLYIMVIMPICFFIQVKITTFLADNE